MAGGLGPSSGSDNKLGPLGKLDNLLENRLALLLVAATLGIGGNLAIVKTNPEVRADKFTGSDWAVERAKLNGELYKLENRLDACKQNQQRINQSLKELQEEIREHDKEADTWKRMIQSNTDAIRRLERQ